LPQIKSELTVKPEKRFEAKLGRIKVNEENLRKPKWLTKRLSYGQASRKVYDLLRLHRLHTVCEEAHCPNLGNCFSEGTATFMILGDRCTRNCRFCAVHHGTPLPPDNGEPEMVAGAVEELGLMYAVVTSVTRDDLHDGGSAQFAETIHSIRAHNLDTLIEVLIPDFQGSAEALEQVINAGPDVINHNIETVPRLYPKVRPEADYRRSLDILLKVQEMDRRIPIKSGLMLGLGENRDELSQVFNDLLRSGCRMLTLGQYLAPSKQHHPVVRYVSPEEFADLEQVASRMGFKAVAAGPFVRSSFKAGEMFRKAARDSRQR
jgi:lipoic acid synthetase